MLTKETFLTVDGRTAFGVTRLGRYIQSDGWEHNGKKCEHNLLVIVISGQAVFSVYRNDYLIKKGDYIVVPKDTFYKVATNDFCEYYFFHFEMADKFTLTDFPACSDEKNDNIFDVPKVKSYITINISGNLKDSYDKIIYLVTKCYNRLISHDNGINLYIDANFSQIMLKLNELCIKSSEKFPKTLFKILVYIQQNYTKKISLADISQEFGLSKQHIIRLFKVNLNSTTTDYINKIKLEHSVELLKYSKMNLNEISDYLGFGSVNYFCRIFRKVYQMPPRKYSQLIM